MPSGSALYEMDHNSMDVKGVDLFVTRKEVSCAAFSEIVSVDKALNILRYSSSSEDIRYKSTSSRIASFKLQKWKHYIWYVDTESVNPNRHPNSFRVSCVSSHQEWKSCCFSTVIDWVFSSTFPFSRPFKDYFLQKATQL